MAPMGRTVLAAVALAACGGSTAAPSTPADGGGQDAAGDSAPADGSGGDASGSDSSADSSAEGGYLACMSASGQVDGSLKACQSDMDCVIEQEQTDCCGTILYVGVRTASASMFQACEAAWVAHFPACGCDSGVTKTEDGKATSPGVDGGAPQVHCTDFTMSGGVCMTYTP